MDYQYIYNLDDKINFIYDFLYNVNTQNKYLIDKIILGKISIDDIKISLVESNNKDKLDNYDKNKNDILNSKFKLIDYDNINNIILLKRYSDQFSVLVKIVFYKDYDTINSFDSHINNDSLFSYLLSHLVLSNKVKHILIPIINFDINYSYIENIIPDNNIKQNIKESINYNKINNICCLQLREYFFKSEKIIDYMKNNDINYKALLFQIIYTITIIQNEYEGFRHNNLILDNIVLFFKKNTDYSKNKSLDDISNEYEGFNNDKFYITNVNFDIKITNFEYAIIPKFYGLFNSNDKINVSNSYYDIYTILNDLWNFINNNNKSIDKSLKNFFNMYLPSNIRNNYNNNSIIIKPIDLLYDIYFSEYLKKKDNSISPNDVINNKYLSSQSEYDISNININTILESDNISYLGNQKKIQYNNKKSNINIMNNNKLYKRIIKTLSNNDNIITRNNISNIIMHGGTTKLETNPYKAEKNTPFISNDQKNIQDSRNKEVNIREPPIILEQKVYDTSQKTQSRSQIPPSFIPLYDPEGKVINQMLPYSNIVNQPPLQKVYNVSLSNPLGNYSSINKIYEDTLPNDPTTFSALTIFERTQLIDFLRNNILEFNDGEEMTITGGKNSLLSFIKILDVNPYSINNNPYIDLPRNFLLYRAAYPVRFEDKSKSISIGKPSMGINIRIYMMSYGDLNCRKINFIDADNFDLWREIAYYDWVKNIIIKRKISPNFISPILYKIDSQSKIDWNKLELIKSKNAPNDTLIELQKNQQKINSIHNLEKQVGLLAPFIPLTFRNRNSIKNLLSEQDKIDKDNINNKEDITIDSGKILILLTEAPTTNILQWASCIYESYGSIKKMVSTGYHTPDIWKSILFQLIYSCAILYKKIILFDKLSLENNIYIKDIQYDPTTIGSWIYKIDNIEYYVPNYGYILVIDSKFADIEVNSFFIKDISKQDEQNFKIYGSIYKNNSKYNNIDDDTMRNIIKEQFKNLINPDNFGYTFKIRNGSIPDDSIINLLRNMWNDTTTNNIKDYIHKYFREYLHNRLGTLLYKSEQDNINIHYRPDFTKYKGKLMVWLKRYQEFEWIIYKDDSVDVFRKKIIRKDNNNYIDDEVYAHTLFNYPDNEVILPEVTKTTKLEEFRIYETYDFDNLI